MAAKISNSHGTYNLNALQSTTKRMTKQENKPIRRQTKWQKANIAKGLCRICNKKRVNATFCDFHAQKARDHANASKRKSKKG